MSAPTLTVDAARDALGESLKKCCIASFFGKGVEQRSAEYLAARDALIAAVRSEERRQRDELIAALRLHLDHFGDPLKMIRAVLAKVQP